MYNESYEEYIRSILGYPNYNNSHFENDGDYSNNFYKDYNNNFFRNDDDYYLSSIYRNIEPNNQIESYYPEIYKIVYPMIVKACANNQRPITSELIDELTDEIYNTLEVDNEIKVNINLNNETALNNRSISATAQGKKEIVANTTSTINQAKKEISNNSTINQIKKETSNNSAINQTKKEMLSERKNENSRQFRNNSLRDLIKILLIRDLIGNSQNRPNRPPMIRPPFSGIPGGPGTPGRPGGGPGSNNPPRPPMMPRYNF